VPEKKGNGGEYGTVRVRPGEVRPLKIRLGSSCWKRDAPEKLTAGTWKSPN